MMEILTLLLLYWGGEGKEIKICLILAESLSIIVQTQQNFVISYFLGSFLNVITEKLPPEEDSLGKENSDKVECVFI